jgi:hypothetical protein
MLAGPLTQLKLCCINATLIHDLPRKEVSCVVHLALLQGRKLAGVALKVNTKLGGDNTTISGDISTWCTALKR